MIFFTSELSAQREIGISTSGFSNFGLMYKVQKEEGKYFRYEALYFNSSLQGTQNRLSLVSSIGFSGGIEKRESITDKFSFIRGFMPGITIGGSYSQVSNNNDGNLTIVPSIGYLIGGLYHISDDFYIGLDVLPSIRGAVSFGTNQDVAYNLTTVFNIDNVGLSAVYKFGAKN